MREFAECSNKLSNEAAGEKKPEAYLFSPAHPELPRQLFASLEYVEDFLEPKMKLETCFSILLAGEDTFKIIPECKDHHTNQ